MKQKQPPGRRQVLQVLRPQVAGIDLGSREHWACGPLRADGKPNVRTFGTTTGQLRELADWLAAEGVESVAMESTHVYWIPLHELLEERGFEVLLVNARQLRNVPGRKTDMQDCQWLQQLHSCGLLRGSFRPHESVTRRRSLHRQMQNLVRQRTRFVQWMQQALDQMNVQVHWAVSDLTGQTGMAIVRAIVSGERDPGQLAGLRDARCGHTAEQFAEYLTGNWREEHLFNLESSLKLYDGVQEQIGAYERKLQQELQQQAGPDRQDEDCPRHRNQAKEKAIKARGGQPMRTTLFRYAGTDLTRIDGISAGAARTILTEIGPDLSAFPTEKHFASWLGLAPAPRGVWRQAAASEATRPGHGSHARIQRPADGRDGADPFQVRPVCGIAPQGAPQGHEDGRLRHRAQAREPGLPHVALGTGLRRRGRGGLRRAPSRPYPRLSQNNREGPRLPAASRLAAHPSRFGACDLRCFTSELSPRGRRAPCRDDSEDIHLQRLRPIMWVRASSGDESSCPDRPGARCASGMSTRHHCGRMDRRSFRLPPAYASQSWATKRELNVRGCRDGGAEPNA